MDQTARQIKVEVEDCFIEDLLPSEMLLEILKRVDSTTLFSCRRVSRNWLVFATEVCQSRWNLELQFDSTHAFEKGSKMMTKKKRQKTSLEEFTLRFGSSKCNFPYARFRFNYVNHSTFSSTEWNKFLVDFGENQKLNCLKLGATNICDEEEDLMKLTEKLSDLLLNQVPNLQEFGLQLDQFSFKNSKKSSEIKLFQLPAKAQLPHLKVLHLSEFMFLNYSGISSDLLRASVNLVKIQSFENSKLDHYNSIEAFLILQSLGKLQCLQDAKIELTPNFLSKIQMEKTSAPLAFKLKTLEIHKGAPFKTPKTWKLVSIFLSNLFESCKDNLRELKMDSFGFLPKLQFPKFSKLAHLHIFQSYYGIPSTNFLPSGVKFEQVFPFLQSLDLKNRWSTIFPPAIPSLTSLKIVGKVVSGSTIALISARCPNLKKLVIKGGGVDDFPEVGNSIWTNLTGLESLELLLDVHTTANAFPAIDSCISGFSREDCFRLYKLHNFRVRAEGATKVPKIELLMNFKEMERENPSILNLKDLKHFKIHLASYYSANGGSYRHQNSMSKVMTFISEDCALKLIENLKYEIIGRPS